MKIFLEPVTFDSIGGWTMDTQSLETLGSAYLLAHGIGTPVADAVTGLKLSAAGHWRVFARTRNWTAAWHRGTPAGRFQLLMDGTPLPEVLGTNGPEWAWQFAGEINVTAGSHVLALHDLTGFDGRCDGIFLTNNQAEIPPDDKAGLDLLRKRGTNVTKDPEEYDLLVCGGGFAGLCTGLSARESGLRIKVIQDRPVAGGCGSSEIRVWTGGSPNRPPYPELGNVAAALSPLAGVPGMRKDARCFEDDRKELAFNPGELLLSEAVMDVEMDPADENRIRSIVTRSLRTGKETRRRAKFFADCTGDGLIARKAGCFVMYGCEGREDFNETLAPAQATRMVMGHSVLWETGTADHKVSFPDIDWGIEFNDANAIRRFNCCWDWETGQFRDQVREIEYIRDYGLMTCYANWSFLKNRSANKAQWANRTLDWVSPIGGKRESYRIKGALILTQNDILNNVRYEDGTVPISWSIDLHLPDPENQRKFGEAFQSCAYHYGLRYDYPIPYRCLYPAEKKNLFLGGRILSATHVAFSCIRVMRTLGALGEVAGMAAALCIKFDCTPHELYLHHLDALKEAMRKGVKLHLPCDWGNAPHEACHFMRPVGSCGNTEGEDCWLRFRPDKSPEQPIPESLAKAIRELKLSHPDGTPFEV